MKQILLIFLMGFISLGAFSQNCPKIIVADIITVAPNSYKLHVEYTADGQKHIVVNFLCNGTQISTTCIDAKKDGTYEETFSCTGVPSVQLIPGTGTCINGTDCGTPVFVCPSCGPMPVTLSNFSVIPKEENVLLAWQTQTEINSSHFDILRSYDNKNFEVIGTVNNLSANSSQTHNYSFIDYKNTGTDITYYKLKIVDRDGKYTFSEIKTIRKNNSNTIDFNIYPNPAISNSSITISGINGPSQIQFMDNSGRVVKNASMNSSGSLELFGLQRGTYFLVITDKKTGNSVVKKLSIVR